MVRGRAGREKGHPPRRFFWYSCRQAAPRSFGWARRFLRTNPMSTLSLPAVQSLLLDGVDWKMYTRLLRAFDKRRSIRLTYDRGSLEIMTLTHEHESYAHLLGRFVVVLTEEFGLPIKGGGSTTFRRRRRRKGLEADESYW